MENASLNELERHAINVFETYEIEYNKKRSNRN